MINEAQDKFTGVRLLVMTSLIPVCNSKRRLEFTFDLNWFRIFSN